VESETSTSYPEKIDALIKVLDALRPGTGGAIGILLRQAYEAGQSEAKELLIQVRELAKWDGPEFIERASDFHVDAVTESLRAQLAQAHEDIEHLKELLRCDPGERIEDGFGSAWSRTCPTCGLGTMHVNRPGEIQCDYCG
jgi:hypothetical protein